MSTGSSAFANRVILAVLWIGLFGFLLVHSLVLVRSTGEQTLRLVRSAWFVGLVALILAFWFFRASDRPSGRDA